MNSDSPRTPDTDDETIRAAADHLQARFARGEITATQYREQLRALKAGPAEADSTPAAPTTRYRGPAKRTATAPAPKRRETR